MRPVYVLILFQCLFVACGFSQKKDSFHLRSYDHFKRSLYAPASLIAVGIIANGNAEEAFKNELAEERNEHLAHFCTRIDNYLQFSPILVAYWLDALGVRSRTDLANRTAILL